MNARNWPLLRQRPEPRHGGLPRAKETPMPSSFAASLPLHITEPAPAPAPETPPEPDKIAECGFCHVSGLSSQIPEAAGLRRCWPDIDGCVQREVTFRLTGARPRPLLSAAEMVTAIAAGELEPLPEDETTVLPAVAEAGPEDAADAAQEASTEALARWAPGQDLSEDEGPREDAAEPPADTTEPAPGAEAEAEPAPEGEVQP